MHICYFCFYVCVANSIHCSIGWPKSRLFSHMSYFQNLRNRRYYISGHQVSRSVSKSSGTIGSTRKNNTYIVYMYTCEMHKHDVAYCHTLQTLIFWPLCLSEDCRKNEKKSSQTKRERHNWYQSAAPGSHFTSYAWKLSTSRYYIKVGIPTFPYPWGLQNDTPQRYQNDTHIRPFLC